MSLPPFIKVQVALFGFYMWEVLTSLEFDWQLITRRRKFTIPMLFYVLNKYFFMGAVISGFVSQFNYQSVSCTASYKSSFLLGNMSLGLAGMNLAIRTVAIWAGDRRLMVGLSLLILIHWVIIIIHVAGVHAKYIPNMGCSPPEFSHELTIIILVYSLFFDALVCTLNFYKLRANARVLLQPSKRNFVGIAQVVLLQGLIYFIIAFLVNFSTIIMLSLGVAAPIFSAYIAVSEGVISIVACRAVRSLANTLHNETDIHISPSSVSRPSSGVTRSTTTENSSGYNLMAAAPIVKVDITSYSSLATP
ncbi:hypothetical protein CPB83DRAFT_889082 [Crepidotus variabilis]|uniref:Uncharacterized protein n=1 Tax=Crepidotus variabilis TaxID=179855 RepID=A0A9P6JWK5_9AGAR|nr:hypothetical protein CPB83DRAFT_889082 [Crepidotus variabilis]